MEHDFWLTRWDANTTAFHEGAPNTLLRSCYSRAGFSEGSTLFVPLCGKAIDMLWLREQGHRIVGVELSTVATRAFFEENGLEYEHSSVGEFEVFEGDGITLLAGDFFGLEAHHLSGAQGVYDRASLVALPPEIRARYAERLVALVDASSPILTITFEYDQAEMNGPPFSVPPSDVAVLFGQSCDIETLESQDALEAAAPLKSRGLTALMEHAFLMRGRA
jgi:thiopurine S-methyltransferase